MPNMNVRSPDATSAAPSPTSPKCTRSFNDFASGVKNSWPYREYSPCTIKPESVSLSDRMYYGIGKGILYSIV